MILFLNVCAQAQGNSDKVTIDRATAEAAQQAFDEALAGRATIKDLRAENASLSTNLDLANRLAESERLRAESEKGRADAEAKRAEALQVALDASKGETAAQTKIAEIRTEEAKVLRADLKKQKRKTLGWQILFVASHVARTIIGF